MNLKGNHGHYQNDFGNIFKIRRLKNDDCKARFILNVIPLHCLSEYDNFVAKTVRTLYITSVGRSEVARALR